VRIFRSADTLKTASKRRVSSKRPSLAQQQKQMNQSNMKAVSNIHQLYQDLFITDMKDEIAVASNEVVQLRQELLKRDK